MTDAEYRDYLIDCYEFSFGINPFEGMTEEEAEEFLRELNEDFEDDYQRNGRF